MSCWSGTTSDVPVVFVVVVERYIRSAVANLVVPSRATSGFKGVSLGRAANGWEGRLHGVYLGSSPSPVEAARNRESVRLAYPKHPAGP